MNPRKDKPKIDKGHEWEDLAETYLRNQGYTIIARNWRSGRQEIDIIASKENTIVFVEVKGSLTEKFGHPSERVDKRKQENLIRAAQHYLTENNTGDSGFRFDLITFHQGKLEHYPDAFQAESK